LPDIARQLGVANIIEGSVQKAADQVHINVQLIRAPTNEHLWAESYDRKLENIFRVEADVAISVAEALKAKLSSAEQKNLEQKPNEQSDKEGATAKRWDFRDCRKWQDEFSSSANRRSISRRLCSDRAGCSMEY